MWGWILAAIIGAVPLYFGFGYGRKTQGMTFWITIGILMSLVIVGLILATGTGSPVTVIPALAVAYFAGVGALGALGGGVVTLMTGPPEEDE